MSIKIYPADWAALNVDRAGEKYRPSNSTEGEFFFDAWCRCCARDNAMREGADLDERDDNEWCDIITRTCTHNVESAEYPVEWQYAKDGQPCCTAFVEAGEPIPPPRCEHTPDLFDGNRPPET